MNTLSVSSLIMGIIFALALPFFRPGCVARLPISPFVLAPVLF